MQARRIARELALLSISQLPASSERLDTQPLQNVVVAAVRTLASEAQDALESAAAELQQGNNRLLSSETRSNDLKTARVMVNEAIELTQKAINRVGAAIEVPEMLQLANQSEVRSYALEIISTLREHRTDIDALLVEVLVDWQLDRLAWVDRDILRIAVTEMRYLGTPDRVAVNEAVELSKRYSGEDGHRFINGVLRRVTDRLKAETRIGQQNSAIDG